MVNPFRVYKDIVAGGPRKAARGPIDLPGEYYHPIPPPKGVRNPVDFYQGDLGCPYSRDKAPLSPADYYSRESNSPFDRQTTPPEPVTVRRAPRSPEPMSERFEVIRHIGGGAEGQTDLVRGRHGRMMIRKTATSYNMAGNLPREVKILKRRLEWHPNILHMVDYTLEYNKRTQKDHLLMLYGYCAGGDLDSFRGKMSENFLWHVFKQMAEALAYLHYGYRKDANGKWPKRNWQRIVHRDIKPNNIFLKEKVIEGKAFPTVVLGDFGMATLEEVSNKAGTLVFIPPEDQCSKQGDIWSLGATIADLATCKPPVRDPPYGWRQGSEAWHMSAQSKSPRSLPRNFSTKLNKHMMSCLSMEPSRRPRSIDLFKNLEKDSPGGFLP